MHLSPACRPCLAADAEITQWAGFLPKASGPRRAKAACELCLVGFSCRLSIPETQAVSTAGLIVGTEAEILQDLALPSPFGDFLCCWSPLCCSQTSLSSL